MAFLKKTKITHRHFRIRCTCNNLLADCGCNLAVTDIFSPCIHRQTPRELFDSIVQEYSSHYEPDPIFLQFALIRIAEAWKINPDRVLNQVKSAVAEKNQAAANLIPGPYA